MRAIQTALILTLLIVAPSCASRGSIHPPFPPAADLALKPEPLLPVEAVDINRTKDERAAIKQEWSDEILLDRRAYHGQLLRLRGWFCDTFGQFCE